MKLSTRGEYGLRAMVALANAYHKEGALSLAAIAHQEGLSLSYLEQLMATLRRAGLVQAVRGAAGGYRLARPPDQITVGQVLRPLESLSLTECSDPQAGPDCCQRRAVCTARLVWQRVGRQITDTLDSTTLADLCRPASTGKNATQTK